MTKFVISSSFFHLRSSCHPMSTTKFAYLICKFVCLKGSHNAYVLYNPAFLDLYQCDNAA